MKKISIFLFLFLFGSTMTPQETFGQSQQSNQHFFQLKVYHFDDAEQQKKADQYFEAAFLPALHRADINRVGVFKPHHSDTSSSRKTYVLIPFTSLDQFTSLNEKLKKDRQYLSDGSTFLKASNDALPYDHIETTLLEAFEEAPALLSSDLEVPQTERVYELRSYESATEALNENKVDMFNAGGEVSIFDRLGFNAVFYGNVIAGSKMPNLMYMTSFKDMESRNQHWKAFGEDPEWKKLAAMEKYQGNMNHADIWFLRATPYSDL